MKRSVFVVMVAVLALSGASAWAQTTESFLGVVKSVNGSSVTVERGSITGIFGFDSKTWFSPRKQSSDGPAGLSAWISSRHSSTPPSIKRLWARSRSIPSRTIRRGPVTGEKGEAETSLG